MLVVSQGAGEVGVTENGDWYEVVRREVGGDSLLYLVFRFGFARTITAAHDAFCH